MIKKRQAFALFALCLAQIATTAEARTYAPRIVSEHNADAYSMKTFAQHPRWRDLRGDDKAWEVFNYLTDNRTGLYPMGVGALEGPDDLYEYNLVRDPVKMLNVYSLGYCDVFGPAMAGLWQEAGFGDARVVDVPDLDHVAAEVYYDNAWHYLDLDLRAAFRRSDGTLASIEDSQYTPSLWSNPKGPQFFPLDDLTEFRQGFEQSDLQYRYKVHESGHTMDFTLRQGETFSRWWEPQGGRWIHDPSYETDPFIKDLIATEPRGPKAKHPSFTEHTYGNGRLTYQPNLTHLSTDFTDGVYDSSNLTPGPSGLTLTERGQGYAVFEIRTPYVIVPVVGNTATTNDDKDASVIEVDAVNASFSISDDNGITWTPVSTTGSKIDLTRYVAGSYGYLFRIELNGEPEQAVVRSLTMTTWVQLAPASLPSLRTGSNTMQVRTGDHYGLQTRVMEIQPAPSSEADLLKHLVDAPDAFFTDSPTSRIHGSFVVAVEAPPATKIAWFSAGGSFESYQLDAAPDTSFTMAYATDVPVGFNEFYSADMPNYMEHWYTNAQAEVQLPQPARAVYLKYEGQPAVNEVRVYAHVLDDNPTPPSAMRITHNWTEAGLEKSFSTTTDNGTSYIIDAGEQPIDVSIEFAVASQLLDSPITGAEPTPQLILNSTDSSDGLSGGNSAASNGGGAFSPSWLILLLPLFLRKNRYSVRLRNTGG